MILIVQQDLLPPLSPDGWPNDQDSVPRLSTKIPGLGSPKGLQVLSEVEDCSTNIVLFSNLIQL